MGKLCGFELTNLIKALDCANSVIANKKIAYEDAWFEVIPKGTDGVTVDTIHHMYRNFGNFDAWTKITDPSDFAELQEIAKSLSNADPTDGPEPTTQPPDV